ncbi:MAG: hypothetical protein HW387_1192 [Parachlamydiales bacterium]|nr:hypothetical protein [Parachlamydiales bacterium]
MTSIQKAIGAVKLKRLDNCTWSYQRQSLVASPKKKNAPPIIEEVQILTPVLPQPGQSFELALLLANILQSRKMFSKIQKDRYLFLEIEDHGSLNGRWEVVLESAKSWGDKLFEWIPFVAKYPPHHCIAVRASQIKNDSISSGFRQVHDLIASQQYYAIDGQLVRRPIYCPLNAQESFVERLGRLPFTDPFTRLAAEALQSVETDFVSERAVQGSCRLVVGGEGQLKVDLISLKDDPREDQRTVRAYQEFLLDELGQEYVDYAQYAYGFNFNGMIARGLPLLPDHVYKMNVGANNIEMGHLESLYKRLILLRMDLLSHPLHQPIDKVLEYYHSKEAPVRFCMRELRGMARVGGKEIVDDSSLKLFLDRLIGDLIPDHLPHLMPEQFNALIAMIWPTGEELSRAMTGRQITHLAICGYKTMGNPDQNDPARDQAELLQIFEDLQKCEDWDNFYELLAHVAVKKNLYREYSTNGSDSVWRAGVIIPAPGSKEGHKRWYCVTKVSDNSEGNLNYVLLPAVKGFRFDKRPLPMIHLYRSTNSDRNAIDAAGSIENDFNPQGSPGTLGEEIPKGAKEGYFFKRTIPLWVGMLLYGDNQLPDMAIYSYRDALEELECSMKKGGICCDEKLARIMQLKCSDSAAEIRNFLLAEAEGESELPRFKKAQDIVFVGHSLGGALAQFGIHYFGPGVRRIPCPGFHFICRAYNGPATNTAVDREFMRFGRKYRDLIRGLGQHWKIFHQFEYGDFVPEAGESHLGTNGYNEDRDEEWLDVHIQLFRPLASAHALPITTCPTHGRRISLAVRNFDYSLSLLTPEQLAQFDHSWLLSGELKELFGYKILGSPRITEILRRTVGAVGVPLLHLETIIANAIHPEKVQRDAEGVFSCEYRAACLMPESMSELQKT